MRFLILGLDTPIVNSDVYTEDNNDLIKEPNYNGYEKSYNEKIDINSSSSHFYLEKNSLFDEELAKRNKNLKLHGLIV